MRAASPLLWAALFSCLWVCSLADVKELRLPVPTSETIAAVAREMGAATYEESMEEEDSAPAATARRVQRKLVTGGEDIDDNAEYQEYQGVMGRPGVDFPVLPNIPSTSFSCRAIPRPGYYADLDTDCQVFHICDGGRKISFLCPNGTIFRQSHLICDWWFRVDCGKSVELYEESAEQLAADQKIYRQRAEAISRAMSKSTGAEPPKRVEEPPPPPPPAPSRPVDTSIDAPLFRTAKLNYENRQTARKQVAAQRRRPSKPSTARPTTQETRQDLNPSQLQYKPDDTQVQNNDDQEQQVLSETASFATSRRNRFGNQYFQGNVISSSSQPPQSSPFVQQTVSPPRVSFVTISPSPQPSQNVYFQSSSQTPAADSFPSSTVSPQLFRSQPTQPTPVRSFRPGGRSLPTSSQNNNLRSSVSQLEKNSRKPLNTRPQSQSNSIQNDADIPNPQLVVKPSRQSRPSQNSFARPSPDLIPPAPKPSSNQNITPPAPSQQQVHRGGRFPVSTTTPPLTSSTPSPTSESVVQRRQKQRRLTSTTQKPIFTVKFRQSKSFDYIDLERSRTTETSTPSHSRSSLADEINGLSVKSNKSVKHFTGDILVTSSTSAPVNRGRNKSNKQQYSTTESTFRGSRARQEASSTQAPNENNFSISSASSQSSSYSPTIPEQFSSSVGSSSTLTTPGSSNNQEDLRMDKLIYFTTIIDPAEINLLDKNHGNRNDLRIPESSGPNALHTLALYYATSETDTGTTPAYTVQDTLGPEELETVSPKGKSLDIEAPLTEEKQTVPDIKEAQPTQKNKVSDEILLRSHSGSPDSESEIDQVVVEPTDAVSDLPTVLTKATKDSFAFLFNETKDVGKHIHEDGKPCPGNDVIDLDTIKESVTETPLEVKDNINNDLDLEQSRGIVQSSTSTTTTKKPLINPFASTFDELPEELKLKDSTNLRELAQVFSRALSAYLEDPESFRRILSEVRPTEPAHTSVYGTTPALEENDDEVLDFSDANTGPRVIPDTLTTPDQQNTINSDDIDQINSLINTDDVQQYNTELPNELTVPKDSDNSVFQQFSTVIPTSLAAEIDVVTTEANYTGSESFAEDSYSLPAPVVVESRHGRYGGFHNNSGPVEYKAYGSEVPESATGQPLKVTLSNTDEPSYPTTLQGSTKAEVDDSVRRPKILKQIDIETIPDELDIVPAQDVNSLVDSHNDPADNPDDGFNDDNDDDDGYVVLANDETFGFKGEVPIRTEEEIYGRGEDQEKLLIASGSQSLVSRDNYVRLFNSKHSENVKGNVNKERPTKGNTITETSSTLQPSTTVKPRGSVKYGAFSEDDYEDFSTPNRNNKEIKTQDVKLGNGITLERTKTVRYSTPAVRDSTSTDPFNPASINQELGAMADGLVTKTNLPFRKSPTTASPVRVTTYHPHSGEQTDLPRRIPPRGSLRESWQWNTRPAVRAEVTTVSASEAFQPPRDDRLVDMSSLSTLLPPNVTFETAGEEVLEKKAEEIFGKLNKTSADMLMTVMQQAESNMTVRRLVLLLVADRNEQESKSPEESRSQLIQALLQNAEAPVEQASSRAGRARGRSRVSPSPPTTTTTASFTTTTQSGTTTRGRGSKSYSDTQPETQYLRSPNLFPQNSAVANSFGADPDARAVELLKSLYNLAARWG